MSCKVQTIFLWCLKVSWIARMSKITLLKFDKSWNVLPASKYFSMISKRVLDCQMVQDTFLKYGKSWNVLQASKYFPMTSKSLLDCKTVQDYFPDVLKALECLASLKIFFYDCSKSPGLPECLRWPFCSVTSPGMSCKLQNIFLWILKVSWIAWRFKRPFLKFYK